MKENVITRICQQDWKYQGVLGDAWCCGHESVLQQALAGKALSRSWPRTNTFSVIDIWSNEALVFSSPLTLLIFNFALYFWTALLIY